MKKVNWTTKGELFGSTRVVILFLMFHRPVPVRRRPLFYAFFHLIGVLQ